MNKIKTVISLITFFINIIIFSQPNKIIFSHLTTEDGLSTNAITNIIQDKYGFIWIGTYYGLNRYDGYNFKVFLPNDKNSNSISNHQIWALLNDREGNIWIGTFDGLNRYDPKLNKFFIYKNNPKDPASLSNNYVLSLFEDSEGNIWVGTLDGLNKYNRDKDNFSVIKKVSDRYNVYSNSVLEINEDKYGTLWLGTWNGLTCMKKNGEIVNQIFNQDEKTKYFNYELVTAIYRDKDNNMWIGTNGMGLFKYDITTKKITNYKYQKGNLNSLSNNYITSIIQDTYGNIWIGTRDGLNKIDINKNKFTRYYHNDDIHYSLIGNDIYTIYQDKTGLIWVGTSSGISKFYISNNNFHFIQENKINPSKGLTTNRINSIDIYQDSIVWIATTKGLNKVNIKTKKITQYYHQQGKKNTLVDNYLLSVKVDSKGYVWIGSFDKGLNKYNSRTGEFALYRSKYNDSSQISNDGITSIYEDSRKNLWFGTWYGLNLYDKIKNKFYWYIHEPNNRNSLRSSEIWCIYEDSKGYLWIGTEGGGASRYNPIKNEFLHFGRNSTYDIKINSNFVYQILETKDGLIWFATNDGLTYYNPKTKEVKTYTINDGLLDNVISSIQCDDKDNLWIATMKGITKFDRRTNEFINYDRRSGLLELGFSQNVTAKTKNGYIFFASNDGLVYFHPDSLYKFSRKASLIFTDLKIFNKSVTISSNSLIKQSIETLKEIKIPSKYSVITLDFALMDFYDTKRNRFRYKLKGFNDNWYDTYNNNSVTFTNLPPGQYQLIVQGYQNYPNEKNKSEANLIITIVPEFYETSWFKILVIISLLGFTISFIKYRIKKVEKINKLLEEKVNDRTKELDSIIKKLNSEIEERKKIEKELIKAKEKAESSEKLKSEFLAQMSHEIRSPVHTILNFTDLIKELIGPSNDEIIKESFDSIERTGERIVRTIDLILNMSELQTGSYECIYKKLDINLILRRLYTEFSYKAKKKNIDLILNINDDELNIIADEYSVVQIFVNLIDNAIKYTHEGKVEVSSFINEKGEVVVKVADTGIGISEEFLPNLFTAFYQEQRGYTRQYEGNGLGLALVKKYCEINNAGISVESKKGFGSTFTVIFNNISDIY